MIGNLARPAPGFLDFDRCLRCQSAATPSRKIEGPVGRIG